MPFLSLSDGHIHVLSLFYELIFNAFDVFTMQADYISSCILQRAYQQSPIVQIRDPVSHVDGIAIENTSENHVNA